MRGGFVGCVLAPVVTTACMSSSAPSETGQTSQRGTGSPICLPGQSIACGGPGSCVGYQVCADDGSRYEPCVCDPNEVFLKWNALCPTTPAPSPLPMSSDIGLGEILTGKWWYCGGAGPFDGAFELLVVPIDDRAQYYLLTLTDGVLERRTAPDSSGTFQFRADGFWYTTGQGLMSPEFPLAFEKAQPADQLIIGTATYVRVP